jgi:anti-sigma-K factor RskA
MKIQDSKLKQMLAAEYVLGTLRGAARRRFQRLLGQRRDLQTEVRYWESRLASLQAGFKPEAPRAVIWAEIDRRINAQTVTALPSRQSGGASLNFWRTWAAAATAASVVLAVALARQSNLPPPAPQIVRVEVPVAQPLPFVAMLQPSGVDARWMVSVSPERKLIRVSATGGYALPSSECLELWVIGDDGQPVSLGVLPMDGEGQMDMPRGVNMPAKPTLAVSKEPIGGSPTGLPTGPVILAAPALRAS